MGADDLSDFSNHLFTDIGPLLALFGDTMTKQYLSESTSFLDYFIFAMAPIGILTAITSAIRVCGHPSFRAFIGRSQEGDGDVEVELCTSTSRGVCEMFNRGGITRVLGRLNILELIDISFYRPRVTQDSGAQNPGSQDSGSQDPGGDNAGLFLFRHYLEEAHDPETCDWKRDEGFTLRRPSKQARPALFAPNPNLSLNVGIVQRSR